MGSNNKQTKPQLDESSTVVTAGVTADNRYSLGIRRFGDEYCLCVFKCDHRGGLHYTGFSKKELITAISPSRLAWAATRCNELNNTGGNRNNNG